MSIQEFSRSHIPIQDEFDEALSHISSSEPANEQRLPCRATISDVMRCREMFSRLGVSFDDPSRLLAFDELVEKAIMGGLI